MARSLSAPPIIRRETPENVPAVIPQETPPLVLPEALNPQQSRRGFLGFMGNIAARLATRPGVASHLMLSPEERIMQAVDSYTRDISHANNLAMEGGASDAALTQAFNRLHGGAWDREHMQGVLGDARNYIVPWHDFGGMERELRAELARRAGVPERSIVQNLGNDPGGAVLHPFYGEADDVPHFHDLAVANGVRPTINNYVRHQLLPEESLIDPNRLLRAHARIDPDVQAGMRTDLTDIIAESGEGDRIIPGPPRRGGALSRLPVEDNPNYVGHEIEPRSSGNIRGFTPDDAYAEETAIARWNRLSGGEPPEGVLATRLPYQWGAQSATSRAGTPLRTARADDVQDIETHLNHYLRQQGLMRPEGQ